MGLIKTAIMTGGGIYAVKQLAKTAERRHDNQNYNNYNSNNRGYPSDNGYQNQGYYGPPSQPPHPHYQNQRQWSDNNQGNDERTPPKCGSYGPSDYNDQKRYQNVDDYQYQRSDSMACNPPSYYTQHQQHQHQQGYAMASQDRGGNRVGPSSGLGGLANMAIEFTGTKDSPGSKRNKMDKGTQMVSEFFGR